MNPNILSKLRFSRRQVTKRKFNIGGAALPPTADRVPDTKVSPTAAFVVARSFKVPKGQSDRKGHQELAELTHSSPLALIVEQNENAPVTEEGESSEDDEGDGRSKSMTTRSEVSTESLRKRQKKTPSIEEGTPPPGDVSVSFLASTPKPGRPQLSRRRPFTAVHEVQQKKPRKELIEISQSEKNGSMKRNMSIKNTSQQKKLKMSVPERVEEKIRKSTELSNVEQESDKVISIVNKLNVSKKKNINKGSAVRKVKSSDGVDTESVSKKRLGKASGNMETTSGTLLSNRTNKKTVSRKRKMVVEEPSERAKDKTVKERETSKINSADRVDELVKHTRGRREVNENSINNTSKRDREKLTKSSTVEDIDSNDDEGVADDRQTSEEKVVRTAKTASGRRKVSVSVNQLQGKRTKISKQTGISNLRNTLIAKKKARVESSHQDITVLDKTLNNIVSGSSKQKRVQVNTKLAAISKRTKLHDASLGPDQTLMVLDHAGIKRTRSDVMDIDVVLNTVTEVLDSELDICDDQKEQLAIRQLEKYLVHDITSMVNTVQTVRSLQARIKKSKQNIKLKQKSLMAAQKERVEMEEKSKPAEEQNKKDENMKQINACLGDLKLLISRC